MKYPLWTLCILAAAAAMVWLAGILLPAPDAQGGAQVALKETVVITDPLGRFRARFIAGYAKESRTLLEDLKMRLGG